MAEKSMTVLLTEEGGETIAGLQSALRRQSITPVSVPRNGKSQMTQIRQQEPDGVVLHAFMPEMDAISVMELCKREMSRPPVFLVIGMAGAAGLEKQMMAAGADYYVMLPADPEQLALRVRALLGKEQTDLSGEMEEGSDPELVVTDLMHQLGVPAHIKGYSYIRSGILLSVEDREMVGAVTKQLYPAIAKAYQQMMKAAGIKIVLDNKDTSKWAATMNNHDYDVTTMAWQANNPWGQLNITQLYGSKSESNYSFVGNDEIDQLAKVPGTIEDQAEAVKAANKAEKAALALYGTMPMNIPAGFYAVTKGLANWGPAGFTSTDPTLVGWQK